MGAWDRRHIGRAECWVEFDRLPTKQRPKFDGRHHRTYTPKATVEAEKHVRECWEQQVGGHWAEHEGEVRACISIERPLSKSNPKSWAGRADLMTPDLDNTAKLCLDALNGLAFKDDRQVTVLSVARVPRMPYREDAKVRVRISIDYYEEKYEKGI